MMQPKPPAAESLPRRDGLSAAQFFLLDAAIASWLWFALQRFTGLGDQPGNRYLGPALAASLLSFALGTHRCAPGRWLSMLLKAAVVAAAVGALGGLHASRSWLHLTIGEAWWMGGATGVLIWLSRAVYFGTLRGHARQRLEVLRWVLIGTVATLAMAPFYYSGGLGSGDAHWYAEMLGDFITQLRAGVFPVWVGQSTYAFNGAVSPLRFAPAFQYLGGLLDLATFQSLEMTPLRNAELAVTAVAGAFSAYACLKPMLAKAPWIACALAILWILSPGVLAPVMVGDQYMTFMSLPFIPLVLHGCWRIWRFGDRWGRLFLAVGLAGTWLCHPPVALWFTVASACMYVPILLRGRPFSRELKLTLFISAAFLVLSVFTFISVLTLDNQLKDQASGRQAAEVIHANFPANFLPIQGDKPGLPTYQLGYALLGTLLLSLRLMVSKRNRGAWAFATASVLIIPFTIPVPWLTDAIWTHVPGWFVTIQNIWPMQRLFLVWSSFVVFTAAVVMGGAMTGENARTRSFLFLCLVVGIGWSASEAAKIEKGIYPFRSTPEDARISSSEDNLQLTRYAYASYTYTPSYFSHAYMDPWLENRLLDIHTLEPIVSNADAAGPLPADAGNGQSVAQLVESGTLTGSSVSKSEYYLLTPALSLEKGKRYALRLNFDKPGIEGTLQIRSRSLFREYMLPDSGSGIARRGPSFAFGADPWNSHVLPISGYDDGASLPTSMFIGRTYQGESLTLGKFWLYSYKRDDLPVAVESWIPYKARVEAPKAAYLETPRMWLKGWKASVNGQWKETQRSPENLVMVPVGAGVSRVTLRYSPTLLLVAAFWVAALGWSALACAGLCQLALWSSAERLDFGWIRSPDWLSGLVDMTTYPFTLAWRHKTVSAIIAVAAVAIAAMLRMQEQEEVELGAVGPVRIEFTRPHGLLGYSQPLLTTGRPGAGTIVFVTYLDINHARIGADVWGTLLQSQPVEMDFGKTQTLVVSDSALYPLSNPRVKELDPAETKNLRGEVRIELNGKEVIRSPAYAYETTASQVLVGEAPFGSTTDRKFAGDILKVSRLPIPRSLGLPSGRHAHLKLKFPVNRIGLSEPIVSVSSGPSQRVVYVTYLDSGKLLLTTWGPNGVPRKSAEVLYDPKIAHELDVGPGEASDGSASFDVACYFDGVHVIGHNRIPSSIPPVLVSGLNAFDAPDVETRFTGPELNVTLASDTARGDQPESDGPVHMVVTFPTGLSGRNEPLVTTGRTGAGDFIYATYVDAGHIRIGFDHWGYGGKTSEVIPIDYAVPHELWIAIGSLYPAAGDDAAWKNLDPALRQTLLSRIAVLLDGRTIITTAGSTHPTTPQQVLIAKNRIGGSTCEADFNGSVVFVERGGPAPPPNGVP